MSQSNQVFNNSSGSYGSDILSRCMTPSRPLISGKTFEYVPVSSVRGTTGISETYVGMPTNCNLCIFALAFGGSNATNVLLHPKYWVYNINSSGVWTAGTSGNMFTPLDLSGYLPTITPVNGTSTSAPSFTFSYSTPNQSVDAVTFKIFVMYN